MPKIKKRLPIKKFDYVIIAVVLIAIIAFFVFQKPSDSKNTETNLQKPQDIITCEDSDGTNIATKGTVIYTVNDVPTTYTDECSGSSILKEFTCNGNRVASRLQKCNCQDGKCI